MKTLLHFPHTSMRVPDAFWKGLTIPRADFHRYNLEMADVGVDELFGAVEGERVKAEYSRLYCDVERFRDDAQEPMAKYGQGLLYTRLYDAKLFHSHDEDYRQSVLAYYDRYHRELDSVAQRLLQEDNELLILDCHSFSDRVASHFFLPPFPDICIGVDWAFYDEEIVQKIIYAVRAKGYSYAINYPYSGSLVPNGVLSGAITGKVVSVMIEVNKRIYL